ncbi:MAG: cell wall hydrolase [Mobilitalea sp.]
MNKTKRALLSMIVVTTVFCLTIIFNIQFPLLTRDGNTSDETDVVETNSNALTKEETNGKIELFSYSPGPTESPLMDQYQSEQDGTSQTEDETLAPLAVADNTAEDEADAAAIPSEEITAEVDDTSTTPEISEEAPEPKAEEPIALYSDIGICIAKDYVNVRKEPSTDGEVLGKLYRDSGCTILKTEGDWYYIESGSVTGYAKAEYIKTGLSDAELIEKYGTQTACVEVDGLNVRETTSTEAKKLTVIYENETYPVLEAGEEWTFIHIDDENLDGYVKTEMISFEVTFKEAVSKEEEEKILQLKAEERAKKETEIKYGDGFSYTKDDIMLLACLVHSEAGTQSYEGKLAVANIVLNRVKSRKYPDSIKAVIYQAGQFSVAKSGSLQKQLNNYGNYTSNSQLLSIKAAKAALEGANNIGTRLYFHTYRSAAKKGYTDKSNSVKLGDHLFW